MHRKLSEIITLTTTALLLGLPALQSCIYDNVPPEADPAPASIRVNTMLAGGPWRSPSPLSAEGSGKNFTVLFWQRPEKLLEPPSANGDYSFWLAPYLASTAPKAVTEYTDLTFDTNYPYPVPETAELFATGYAPSDVLAPDATEGYHRIAFVEQLSDGQTKPRKGRYDFLGCDAWNEVYYGSQSSPFAQERNKLYFRHLASKLLFYAERDQASMENKQYVRFVEVTGIEMTTDDGASWTPLHTPVSFEWDALDKDNSLTDAYTKVISAVRTLTGVTTAPAAGYRTATSGPLPADFKILRRTPDGKPSVDRVPIAGHPIDSCYVCNPYVDGTEQAAKPIRLRMNISAELSFDLTFPKSDKDGSTTDDLTFTRTWTGLETRIYEVNTDGTPDRTKEVTRFRPGREYRIYLNFSRTGVNLVARELPWDYGGIHYVGITGSDPKTESESAPTP